MTQVDPKYITAFEGILPLEDLQKAAQEAEQFAKDVEKPAKIPRKAVRLLGSILSDGRKAEMIRKQAVKDYSPERDYADVAAKLNGHQFMLSEDGTHLRQLKNAQDLSNLFQPGMEASWPTVVLTANSNLVSPQAFFDTFETARRIIPKITSLDKHAKLVVAGTYFSQRNMQFNALVTMHRYKQLGINPDSIETTTTASQVQAYQLLDLLLERDKSGAVSFVEAMGTNKHGEEALVPKPVLREDAAKVLNHIVCYGYSAGHMANKDAFRILADLLDKGDVLITNRANGGAMRASSEDIEHLFLMPTIIGLAGMDRMDKPMQYPLGAEINFVHPGDLSSALNGSKFARSENVYKIRSADESTSPLENTHGGHAQGAYADALLSGANERVLTQLKRRTLVAKSNTSGLTA